MTKNPTGHRRIAPDSARRRAPAAAGLALLWLSGAAFAQPLLTPEEAVLLGMRNNFSISLARDQTAVAANNRQTGIGPFLPSAGAFASRSGDLDEGDPGRTVVGASVNVPIFEGFRSWHAYQRLRHQETAAQLQERMTLEAVLEGILAGYYAVVAQEQQLGAVRERLAVSEERARMASGRFEVGAGSRIDQLQAQADLNADSSALLTQEIALREARVRLNQLLARDPAEEFSVIDSIPVEKNLPLESWRATLTEANTSVREARAQRLSAEVSIREARGARLPTVQGGLSYSTAPDALNSGPTPPGTDAVGYSLSVSVPVFDALRSRQGIVNSRIGLRRQETVLRQREEEVRAAFEQARARYELGLRQIDLEERNFEVARLQADAARERFRLGASSPLEFRDAQQRLLGAQSRLASVRLSTKQSELALKRLAGVLAAPGAAR